MSVQSWQILCPRCRWSNSGAERRCGKCGQPLRTAPGLLVAGEVGGNILAPKAPPKRVVQAGGFFPRLIAVIIDFLILAVILVPVYYLWHAQLGQVHLDPSAATQNNPFSAFQQFAQAGELALGFIVLLLFYFVGSWTILSGSPGQLVMSLRVVDPAARGIGFGRALMRFVFKSLFSFLSPVSALLVAVGKDKRALHDLFSGTYVIQYLDPQLATQGNGAAVPAAATASTRQVSPQARATTPAGAALAAAAVAGPAPAPQPSQAAARAASAAARAAKVATPAVASASSSAAAAPAAALAAALVEPAVSDPPAAPAGPASRPVTGTTPPVLSILPEPAAEPAPAPFYAVPAPTSTEESSFERYTPPPMPERPSSASLGAPTPPVADAAPAPTAPAPAAPAPSAAAAAPPAPAPAPPATAPAATPVVAPEESMPMPSLPPPAPAPQSAEQPGAPSATPPGPGALPAIERPSEPYPVPFAPLPPVANRPETPLTPPPPEE
jgi:uncharacterized RDD family membrane protein YckC